MFASRIPLPKADEEQARAQWLPRQAGHTGIKFSNGLEMAHNEASKATEAYRCPLACTFMADGVEIRTDGEYSPKAIEAILTANLKPCAVKGQPVKFGNGFRVSHSDESRACADYYNKVVAGKIDAGITATFSNGDNRIEGIQRTAKKVVAKLAK